MRTTKASLCAAALGAAVLTGCSGMGGATAGSGAGTPQSDEMASAGPTVGETASNVAIQAGASQAMKSSGVGGSIGYGLQSHGSSLSRALFGKKKKAAPKPQSGTVAAQQASGSSVGQ